MKEKNVALLTLATALVGTIVICVLAYKLNGAQDQVSQLTNDPLGTIKKLI